MAERNFKELDDRFSSNPSKLRPSEFGELVNNLINIANERKKKMSDFRKDIKHIVIEAKYTTLVHNMKHTAWTFWNSTCAGVPIAIALTVPGANGLILIALSVGGIGGTFWGLKNRRKLVDEYNKDYNRLFNELENIKEEHSDTVSFSNVANDIMMEFEMRCKQVESANNCKPEVAKAIVMIDMISKCLAGDREKQIDYTCSERKESAINKANSAYSISFSIFETAANYIDDVANFVSNSPELPGILRVFGFGVAAITIGYNLHTLGSECIKRIKNKNCIVNIDKLVENGEKAMDFFVEALQNVLNAKKDIIKMDYELKSLVIERGADKKEIENLKEKLSELQKDKDADKDKIKYLEEELSQQRKALEKLIKIAMGSNSQLQIEYTRNEQL